MIIISDWREECNGEKVIGDELTEDEEIEDYPCDTTRMRWRTWAVQLVKNAEGQIRKTLHEVFGMRAEKEAIEARISVTGLSKANFFSESCMYQKILVRGNVKAFSEIKNKMEVIAEEIHRNPNLEDLDDEKVVWLKTILEILDRRFGRE